MTASGVEVAGNEAAQPLIYCAEAQKAMMLARWGKGDTLHQIGKLFNRLHTFIQILLTATGGIRSCCVF